MLRLTVLGSGSSGNCAVVSTDETTLLVDAGLSARQIVQRLEMTGISPDSVNAILLTHEHGDHTRGMEILCRGRSIPIICTPLTQESLGGSITFKSPPRWQLMQTGCAFQFRDLRIESFPVPHDAVDPVGFVIEDCESRLGVLSDVGFITNLIKDRLRSSHSLFVEANYDSRLLEADTKRPWATKQRISSRHGHLSNDQVAELIEAVAHHGLNHIVLGHLSDDCNDPDIATRRVLDALRTANIDGVTVRCAGRNAPTETLEVARRTAHEMSAPAAAGMLQPVLL
ncbi:MAG: MBL fold metallo-hydrolase [Verrucomicrobiaceae bacterium]|nr:MBL fold metallo-hydrolase [Verrucomicrobiaceae bacterium]